MTSAHSISAIVPIYNERGSLPGVIEQIDGFLAAQGLTDPQIAERLFVSRNTVNAHLRNIYGKLDVNTRTAAARLAAEYGLT